jgi:hypothetical protein
MKDMLLAWPGLPSPLNKHIRQTLHWQASFANTQCEWLCSYEHHTAFLFASERDF